MFKIKRSDHTRFENHIMEGDKVVGMVKGGLNYEFTAETVEEIIEKATALKNTSAVSVFMYPVIEE